MSRILFVDDERLILTSLEKKLRRRRPDWEADFASSGAEAEVLLGEHEYDVVVSDMRMPGMDGATLLAIVRQQQPECFRVVLSANMGRDTQLRALPFTHRFLTKPCMWDELEGVIQQAIELRARFGNPSLHRLVGEVRQLPSPPRFFAQVSRMMADPRVSMKQVARVVDRDPAIAARLLHVANSAFFGIRRQIRTSVEALNWLGVDLVRKLVLSSELNRKLKSVDPAFLDSVQSHALLTARISSRMVDPKQSSVAATVALLHRVGQLVLVASRKDELAEVEARVKNGESRGDAERAVLGFTHADVGGHLLNLWGLPLDIVQGVTNHLEPPVALLGGKLSVPQVIHISSRLATAAVRRGSHYVEPRDVGLDPELVDALGIDEQLRDWCLAAHHHHLDMQAEASP
jgi:HD-like signal output (HDOD) protein